MGELSHKDTVYYDVQSFKDDSALAIEAESKKTTEKKETVYHDAQVLQFAELSPRVTPCRKSKRNGCSFLCCFQGRADGDRDDSIDVGSSMDMGRISGKLSSIQEASLTREQMVAQEAAKSKDISRTRTRFYSMGNAPSMPASDDGSPAEESTASNTNSVVRKLSNLIARKQSLTKEKGNEPGYVKRKLSNILTKTISRKPTVRAVLNDEEYEFFSKFHGWWTADLERSDSKDVLAETMELGWALRKAMDNMQDAYYDVQRDRIKNSARVFGIVDIKECRPWSEEKVKLKRKDMRGNTMSWVEKKPEGFVFHSEWPDPYAGYAAEEHSLLDDGETMLLHANVKRESGETCTFSLYFKRKH